jgi:hypothetical protein
MDRTLIVSVGAMLAFAGSLGAEPSFSAGDTRVSGSGNNEPSAFGRSGNQGEGFSEDQTIKGKGRNPDSTIREQSQITLGGARPVVEGQILNIQGDDYVIQDVSGSEVRVRVNKDTDVDCAGGSGQGTSMSTGRHADEQGEIPPTSHMKERMDQQQSSQSKSQEQQGRDIVRQGKSQESGMSGDRMGDQSGTQQRSAMGKDSGGDIARGSGFTIGSKGCAFKTGDKVRAEVSDLGTVLFIRALTEKETGSQQAMSGQMLNRSGEMTPGEQASAQQRAQMMRPGSVPAPPDEQNPDVITRDGKQTAKADTQSKATCEGCKIVRGLVLSSDSKSLRIKDSSQNEVKLKVDQSTRINNLGQPRTGTFIEGDRVEAYVKPDGVAWSITGLKQQKGQSGVDAAPGD